MPLKILITGTSGFIGTHLLEKLQLSEHTLISVSHQNPEQFEGERHQFAIHEATDWSTYLDDVDVVIHLANLAHDNQVSRDELNRVNVAATQKLVSQCVKSGVRQFIYLSSAKVYGEHQQEVVTEQTELDINECDAYGQSKLLAEEVIKEQCKVSTMAFTIIRPPLVYGSGAKANMKHLVKLCRRSFPLPFGSFTQPKSMVSVTNLVSLIDLSLGNKAAYNHVFNVTDPAPTSLMELIKTLRSLVGQSAPLWKVPVPIVKALMLIVGKKNQFYKLHKPLVLSSKFAQAQLGWSPVDDRLQILNNMIEYQNTN